MSTGSTRRLIQRRQEQPDPAVGRKITLAPGAEVITIEKRSSTLAWANDRRRDADTDNQGGDHETLGAINQDKESQTVP